MIAFLHCNVRCFSRLSKPRISEFGSYEDLERDYKMREIKGIEQFNHRQLSQNRSYTPEKMISQVLNVSERLSKQIAEKDINFSAISPKSLKHYTLEKPIKSHKINYPFLFEEVEPNLPQTEIVPMHFSHSRGVPVILQYEVNSKIAYLFNLPEEIKEREIAEKVGIEVIKSTKIYYCRLGLPAYAKIHFNTEDAINNLVINNKSAFELKGRVCFLKTEFDKQHLSLRNRRVVLQGLNRSENGLLIKLSQFGRVSHLDFPTFVTRNSSLQEVKSHYKNSDNLIKINIHKPSGRVESQYYPSLEELIELETNENIEGDFDSNLIQKKQKLVAKYKQRLRFAQDVHVYENKENQIQIQSMGYCVVTYSCTEEAQNCYFNLRYQYKVSLMTDEREDFEFDELYKAKLLRIIDNDFRAGKSFQEKEAKLNQTELQKEDLYNYKELDLFDRLVAMEEKERLLRESLLKEKDNIEPQLVISYFKTRAREIKDSIGKSLGSQSFQEMAETEMFGRVLSKKDQKRLKIDNLPEKSNEMKQIQGYANGQQLSSLPIGNKLAYYNKSKRRATESHQKYLNDLEFDENLVVDDEMDGQENVEDEDYQGKRNFSTYKNRQVAFRKRNAPEQADYILRYCQFVRNTINQYCGVFPENILRAKTNVSATFLNPDELTFSDGTPFLTEEDLSQTLQCMRNFQVAQTLFHNYFKDSQIFKSRNLNILQFKDQVRNNTIQNMKDQFDKGIIKEIYEVDPNQNVEEKIKYLNSMVASFGQEFRAQKDENGQTILVKIAKLESIYPLDRIAVIEQVKADLHKKEQINLSKDQLHMLSKYQSQLMETGEIPEEMRKAFNIPKDQTLQDMFEELSSEVGITKKDIQMLLNLKNYTEEQIAADVVLQMEVEKERISQEESRASSYSKDPSNIEVRDKQGYFKVSKFRQI